MCLCGHMCRPVCARPRALTLLHCVKAKGVCVSHVCPLSLAAICVWRLSCRRVQNGMLVSHCPRVCLSQGQVHAGPTSASNGVFVSCLLSVLHRCVPATVSVLPTVLASHGGKGNARGASVAGAGPRCGGGEIGDFWMETLG